MYEYIVTAFKVLVGVITNERIAIGAAIALGLMLIWVVFSLIFSFQARFASGVRKINNYVSRNGLTEESKPGLDYLVSKMPTEFIRGYRAFERNPKSLPSENIKRFESLDVELSGGVFNQNKSVLKTYMNFVFIMLLLFSMSLLGQEVALSGYLIAEAFIIPVIFLILAKILYYVYTAIRQNQYRTAVEDFNDMLDNLDSTVKQQARFEVQKQEASQGAIVDHSLAAARYRENAQVIDIPHVQETQEETVVNETDEPALLIEQEAEEEQEDSIITRYKAFIAETDREEQVEAIEETQEEVIEETEVEDLQPAEEQFYIDEPTTYMEEEQETEEVLTLDADTQEVLDEEEEVEEFEPEAEEVEEQPEVETEEVTHKKEAVTDNFKPDFSSLLEEEQVEIKRGRGRPRKEVREEGEFVIKNDKEFEEALVRAEKLMRKNEEPLSASQTKRIEKQIKELVDAMTKYKEGK